MKKVLSIMVSLLLFATLTFAVVGCKKAEEPKPAPAVEVPAPAPAPAPEATPAAPAPAPEAPKK